MILLEGAPRWAALFPYGERPTCERGHPYPAYLTEIRHHVSTLFWCAHAAGEPPGGRPCGRPTCVLGAFEAPGLLAVALTADDARWWRDGQLGVRRSLEVWGLRPALEQAGLWPAFAKAYR